jgi:hypothetical protein
MNYRQKFEQFLLQEAPYLGGNPPNLECVQKYVQNMYFVEPHGCVPDKYLGEDVMNDIQTKFYFPLTFLKCLFQRLHPELEREKLLIMIDPSYESATNYIMVLFNQKKILLYGSWNAWSFWFRDEGNFEDWMDNCLKEMECGLREKK